MFKRTNIIFIILLNFPLIIIADEPSDLPLEKIIQNIELAVDPENNKENIKTLITEMELSVPNQDLKLKITTIDKFPDKSKTVVEIPGSGNVVRVINGTRAWETGSHGEFREIKGRELEWMKFELFMKTPSVPINKAFKEITVADRNSLIDDDICFKLVCQPAVNLEVPPVILYVNKDNFLIKQLEMTVETPNGPVSMIVYIEEYTKINGRKVPCKTKINQFGAILHQTLISVKENEKIDDAEFENPEPVEVYKLAE